MRTWCGKNKVIPKIFAVFFGSHLEFKCKILQVYFKQTKLLTLKYKKNQVIAKTKIF